MECSVVMIPVKILVVIYEVNIFGVSTVISASVRSQMVISSVVERQILVQMDHVEIPGRYGITEILANALQHGFVNPVHSMHLPV